MIPFPFTKIGPRRIHSWPVAIKMDAVSSVTFNNKNKTENKDEVYMQLYRSLCHSIQIIFRYLYPIHLSSGFHSTSNIYRIPPDIVLWLLSTYDTSHNLSLKSILKKIGNSVYHRFEIVVLWESTLCIWYYPPDWDPLSSGIAGSSPYLFGLKASSVGLQIRQVFQKNGALD